MLDLNTLPRKGYLSKASRVRQQASEFKAARKQNPAVESAIKNLEQRGLDRVLGRGVDGFERVVVLSVLVANLRRLGLLQHQERERLRRRKRRDYAPPDASALPAARPFKPLAGSEQGWLCR